jgi:hypothetical protein
MQVNAIRAGGIVLYYEAFSWLNRRLHCTLGTPFVPWLRYIWCKVYFCTMGKHTSTRLNVADIEPGSLASSLPHCQQVWS